VPVASGAGAGGTVKSSGTNGSVTITFSN
jgi:hypothetical protein